MIHEDWWEEYKKKTVIMDKYDNPINIVLFSIIVMLVGMTVHIILEWNNMNTSDVCSKIMAILIWVAIWLKAGEIIWKLFINKNQNKKFKEDEQIFSNCLKKYKKKYSNDIENFLDLVCINNKIEKSDLFSSIIFPILCSYFFVIPSILESKCNPNDITCEPLNKNLLYSNIIIVIFFLLACKYIIDFLYDILFNKNRNKKDEYILAIIAKNHLYNIKKNKNENSWGNIIETIINKFQKK